MYGPAGLEDGTFGLCISACTLFTARRGSLHLWGHRIRCFAGPGRCYGAAWSGGHPSRLACLFPASVLCANPDAEHVAFLPAEVWTIVLVPAAYFWCVDKILGWEQSKPISVISITHHHHIAKHIPF